MTTKRKMELTSVFASLLFMLAIVDGQSFRVAKRNTSNCDKHCDVRKCPLITKDTCSGHIVKDRCGCCPQCEPLHTASISATTTPAGSKCDSITCPKQKICMVNIQGLALCRCPGFFMCKRIFRPVCGKTGKLTETTYFSRCHMRIEACNLGKRIQLSHKGECASDPLDRKNLLPKQRRLYDAYKRKQGGTQKWSHRRPNGDRRRKPGNRGKFRKKNGRKRKNNRKNKYYRFHF